MTVSKRPEASQIECFFLNIIFTKAFILFVFFLSLRPNESMSSCLFYGQMYNIFQFGCDSIESELKSIAALS